METSEKRRALVFFEKAATIEGLRLSHISLATWQALHAAGNPLALLKLQASDGHLLQYVVWHYDHKPWLAWLPGYDKAFKAWACWKMNRKGLETFHAALLDYLEEQFLDRIPGKKQDAPREPDVCTMVAFTLSIASVTGWSEERIQSMPLAVVWQYLRAARTHQTGKQWASVEEEEQIIKDAEEAGVELA